jgi:ribose transport system substrate-binding protein
MRVARYLFIILISLLFVACGESKQSISSVTPPPPDAGKAATASGIRVALIMKTLTNPFFIEMEKGARRAQQETGIDLKVMTATQETSIEQQIQLVENQIEARVNAIVIAPGDSERLVPVLKKAQDAGIRVVNIDNRLDAKVVLANGMKPVPFISVDNEKAAYLSAKFAADKVAQSTEAAIFEGIRSADNANQRKLGAERAFRENPRVHVVALETANWKIDEAYTVARRVFSAHPNIGLVFCANDMMAIGVVKFLQETGRNKVLVAGFDALDEAKVAVFQGQMTGTVDQQAAQQGYQGVVTALKLLRGESVPQEVLVESRLVTAGDLK